MRVFSSKQRAIALVAFVVLLLFVLRPGVSRVKSRIVSSISAAVGRQVEVGSVQLRLLPRPGFELHDLVVYDDPAFGAEPMLRCGEVSAALRVTSLLRGRLEVARLDLTEPSLNLVHASQGGWNLEALVERAAHKALAPTSKAKSESRPGFPYIEGTSARINFKSGAEKKPYALTNADFALWQDSENTWGVRLTAQPFRGDFNLNDIGIVQVNGSWQRAARIRDTPMQFNLEWSRAQLGQITKFFSGSDRGWRGAAQLDVTLNGTPANLNVSASASVRDFRRYDIVSGDALKLAARCDGQYSSLDHTFRGLDCVAPAGEGRITVKGDMGFPGTHTLNLQLAAENVPAGAAVALVRRAKNNLPDDLTARGVIQAHLTWQEDTTDPSKDRFEGRGAISDLRLASAVSKTEFGPETIPLLFSAQPAKLAGKLQPRGMAAMVMPEGPHVEFGPFPLAGAHSATARGWIARSGYNIALSGDGEIGKMLRLVRLAGIPALKTNAEGSATIDLHMTGSWSGWSYGSGPDFAGPQVMGTAKLHNVEIGFRPVDARVEIVSGELQLLSERALIDKLNVKAADAQWTGSVELPRGCGTPDACQARFHLNANQVSWRALQDWIDPHVIERPWYRVLDSRTPSQPTWLANLHGAGRVTVDRFEMQRVTATRFAANLRMEHGKFDLSEISADLVGGKLTGEWHADTSVEPALCAESGKLAGISLARVADLMKGTPFTGTASATFDVKGPCGADFWPSAEGTVRFSASDAVLPRFSLADDSAPLRLTELAGETKLREGKFFVEDARVESERGRFQLSGSGALNGELELKLERLVNGNESGFSITGTFAEPRVKPTQGLEQARLKTEPAK